MNRINNRVNILGIPFDALTMEQTLDKLEDMLTKDKNHIVVTPNPEGVMQATRDENVKKAFLSADLSLADGTGIYLGAKIKKQGIPQRVRGVDTIFAFCDRLYNHNKPLTMFLLGGKEGVSQQAAVAVEKKYPNIKVVGNHHGFFKKDGDIIELINHTSPDVLLICTGMPRAEIWATKHRDVNAKITMCLGGTIDIMAGGVKLAPKFIRAIGMEWFYRLVTQPHRAKRMLDIPRFVVAILFEKNKKQEREKC